jgi:hypothetical protein
MPSLMFLTTHRSASSFLSRALLDPLAADLGFERLDPFSDAKRAGVHKSAVRLDCHAGREGCVLGSVRQPAAIKDVGRFDDWTKILLLRDPLDVLTSWWFYTAFGQSTEGAGVVGEKLKANRALALDLGRDDWLRMAAAVLLERYDDYRLRYAGRPNLLLLRYEDMIADWPGFLDRLSGVLVPQPSPAWKDAMMAHVDAFTVETDDPNKHKRQIAPGDHLRKLDPALVTELAAPFGEVIDWLGHPVPAPA